MMLVLDCWLWFSLFFVVVCVDYCRVGAMPHYRLISLVGYFWIKCGSVSYTHLDVYKRQNQCCSTQDSFSESGVQKERVPKVRHKKVRRSG